MALIICPECSKSISDKANQCPHCGYPIKNYNNFELYAEFENHKNLEDMVNMKKIKNLIITFILLIMVVFCSYIGYFLIFKQNDNTQIEISTSQDENIELIKDIKDENELVYEGAIASYNNGAFHKAKEDFEFLPEKYKDSEEYLKNIAKMLEVQGFWQFVRLDEGKNKIIYQIYVDGWNMTDESYIGGYYTNSTKKLSLNNDKIQYDTNSFITLVGIYLNKVDENGKEFYSQLMNDDVSYDYLFKGHIKVELLPKIGMSEYEVRKTAWGNPSKINKTITANGTHEQWVYSLSRYVYLDNGVVTAIHDIVHAHTFPTQLWVALARMFFGDKNIRFITTEHNTYNRRRGKFYFRLIEKFMYSRYDTIVSISEKTKDSLIDWIDPNKKSIYKHLVMENGIDLETIKNALPYKKCDLIDGMTADTKLICMVGRFTEQKDQPALIRAVSKLPEDVHLVLAGEGPLMNDNKALAEKSGISERVHFLGFRNDVPGILKTVDIVVLSSHWEGFGLAAVEGMAAGKPLIASDVDGLREVVKGAGILFNTEEELKNAIISLLNNNALYEEISQKCRDRAERYDIKRMAEDLIKLYSGGSNS